ncbi:ABC-F family ATP-binding cassette domain-containing protein [Streptomyces sp. NPDC056600]|uniref:ABC-F family ATP-binding cassette domain-containing protein n=1 Tax=Streptomyces sp. NPDC056600 TaxID=3345874 RepID=UPI0036BDA938
MHASPFPGTPVPEDRSGAFQLVLDEVSLSPGGRPLLDGVRGSATLGERVGVLGENGSGKSTLLRVLAGLEQPASGRVGVRAPGGVGHLPQVPGLPPEDTVQDAVDHALAGLRALERALRDTEGALATAAPEETGPLLAAYGDLLETFEARDGYAADARVAASLHGLGLGRIAAGRRLGSLSGGEQARLALACALAASPQLLLLDEPTNHLDASALGWLEERLRTHRGTVVVVSHDRLFLERVATTLWEVDAEHRAVHRHGDGYAGYLRARAAARKRWERAYRDWLDELAQQRALAARATDRMTSGARRAATTERSNQRHQRGVERQISARIRNAGERLRRLEENPVPRPPEPLRFRLPAGSGALSAEASPDPEPVAELLGVRVAGRLEVGALAVGPGERLLVTGPNGAGKSTLLRVLAGDLAPERGEVRRTARTAWLPQETVLSHPRRSLLAAYAEGLPGDPEEHREALLSLGLFAPSALGTAAGDLSVGQARRLGLARVLREPAGLLLLDEPTNHLSPGLVEELEEALAEWPGALVVVSHDRMFTRRFEGRRLRLDAGRPAR